MKPYISSDTDFNIFLHRTKAADFGHYHFHYKGFGKGFIQHEQAELSQCLFKFTIKFCLCVSLDRTLSIRQTLVCSEMEPKRRFLYSKSSGTRVRISPEGKAARGSEVSEPHRAEAAVLRHHNRRD